MAVRDHTSASEIRWSASRLSADTLILPTSGKEIPRPWFLPTQETLDEQRRILEARFFLVRIKGNHSIGEALICDPKKGGCGGKHTHITLRCIAQPFSGTTHGLYGYYRAVHDNGLDKFLSPSERSRLDGIGNLLRNMPDLGGTHPGLVRELNPGANNMLIGAFALGLFEAIPKSLAQRYADNINARGIRPKFTLPGLKAR